MSFSFEEHEELAWNDFKAHLFDCEYAPTDERERLYEIELREAEFFEEFQIKMVENLVKIKWEMRCSWVGCPLHTYYCMMANPVWLTPVEIQTFDDKQKKIWEEYE